MIRLVVMELESFYTVAIHQEKIIIRYDRDPASGACEHGFKLKR